MRTKNAKRLWPVSATLTIVALAALLAFGLMATTGAQPAAAQDEPCFTVVPTTSDAQTCSVTGTDATVKFNGVEALAETTNTTTNTTTYNVYYPVASGGDVTLYPIGSAYSLYDHDGDGNTTAITGYNDANDNTVTPTRYAFVRMEITGAKQGASGPQTQSETIMVSGSLAGQLVVYVYSGSQLLSLGDVAGDPEKGKTLPAGPSVPLTIKFLGSPVSTVPDDTLDINYTLSGDQFDTDETEPDVASSLVADGEIGASTDAIMFTTTIRDSNGDVLEGQITYSVEYMLGTALAAGRSDYTTQLVKYRHAERTSTTLDPFIVQPDDSDANTAEASGRTIMVDGWEEKGPVVVKVSASFTGDTGSLTLEKTLKRAGPLDSVVVTATCYLPDTAATEPEKAATDAQIKICGRVNDITPMEEDGPGAGLRPRSVFLAGQEFTIRADALDALGTSTESMLAVSYPDTKTEKGARAFRGSTTTTNPADDASDLQTVMVMTDEEAPPGRYQITLKTSEGTGDDKIDREAMAEIVISGEPAMYTITGPADISLDAFSSGTYTITATDDQGNPPNFDDGDDMVLVVIESDHDIRTTGLGMGNIATLNAETGLGTFTVYKPAGAQSGDIASIGIFVDDILQDSTMVFFGDAPTAPGMPMNVMAMVTSHDMITVSWASPADDGGSDITGYVLQRKTGMMDFMTIAASSAEIWWDTLDCQMMNAEIPDDATPAPPADDTDMTSPYCAMYAGLGAEATTVVDGVFAAEYGTISGTSHSDMGLMAETTYYYRVSAINSAGKGEYSDGMAMATTMSTTMAENMAPMAGAAVADQMVYVDDMVMVQSNFSDPDEDMLSYMASSSDDMIATATVDDMGMVTITGVAEGMATITVTATDMDRESAMQTIMVTVMMATTMMDELGTAMDVIFGVNRGGALQVSWTKAANATGYVIIAVNTNDVNNDVVVAATNDGDDETWNMSGLTRGATYQVYVAATGSGVNEAGNAKFTLSAPGEVTIR